jgi:transcription termination factor Rho
VRLSVLQTQQTALSVLAPCVVRASARCDDVIFDSTKSLGNAEGIYTKYVETIC